MTHFGVKRSFYMEGLSLAAQISFRASSTSATPKKLGNLLRPKWVRFGVESGPKKMRQAQISVVLTQLWLEKLHDLFI